MQARWGLLVMAIAGLAVAGCQAGVRDSGNAGGSPTSAAPAPSDSGGGDPGTGAQGNCPVGTWRLSRISTAQGVDVGDADVKLTGGGSMTLAFTDDGWTLSDDGSQPIQAQVSAAGATLTGTATIKGTLTGKYAKSGNQYGFEQRGGNGTVRIESSIGNQDEPITAVGPALVPSGLATVTCSGRSLRIASDSVTLDLTSTGSGSSGGSPTTPSGGGTTNAATVPDIINEAGTNATYTCANKSPKLNGSNSTIRLLGHCASVFVNSSNSTVTIESADNIYVNGTNNKVTYSGEARIFNNGQGNTVNHG